MTAKVILNPYSDRWQAGRRRPEAEAALKKAGIEYELVESEAPEHAIHITEEAIDQGFAPIIAAGGDGTFGEVVNGFFRAKPEGVLGPIGILPLGTANDLVTNLGLPLTLDEAALAIAGGKTRRIDLGFANQWVFGNNSAVGLEPVVSLYNIRMTVLRGVIRYLIATLQAIFNKPQWTMQIKWDDGEYDGPCTLVTVGNCPVTGGIFRMAPAADPIDGKLTFVYGFMPTRMRMLALLPRAISGDYVNDPDIHQIHTTQLTIRTSPTTPIQVDGEVRSEALSEITYRIMPSRLDLFTP
ncbi:MAG: diacylglycerol kinase family lipid kinase [Anaerolineales bacterium]|jgi:diacylglycerol kinase (ATP)